jgi:predicted membrane-bound mannosyltransferase
VARSVARHRALVVLLAALVALGTALRLWQLGATEFVFDEAFTAVVARLPLHKLFPYLRAHDAHPPFDYLLRRPLALAGASELVLRLPSVAVSVAALVAFAAWMRRRGLLAIIATALMAVSAFQITYGQQARMYACMVAVGVGCAWAASAWLTRPGARPCVAVRLVLLVGLFDHVSTHSWRAS